MIHLCDPYYIELAEFMSDIHYIKYLHYIKYFKYSTYTTLIYSQWRMTPSKK